MYRDGMDSRLLQKKALILIELLTIWGQGSATRISAHEMFTSLALGSYSKSQFTYDKLQEKIMSDKSGQVSSHGHAIFFP